MFFIQDCCLESSKLFVLCINSWAITYYATKKQAKAVGFICTFDKQKESEREKKRMVPYAGSPLKTSITASTVPG